MNASVFELNVLLPADARFAETMRDLAAHAARYAGCRGADADVYGAVVHGVVIECLASIGADTPVRVIVRRASGPVEFLIACGERFDPDTIQDTHIVIGCTREAGGQMCRVARIMPMEP